MHLKVLPQQTSVTPTALHLSPFSPLFSFSVVS